MKKLLITDLDNTLYDWVTFYSRAFRAMVLELEKILNVRVEQLLTEFQEIHRRYGTSEPPFGALELPSVLARFPKATPPDLILKLDPAFHAFNSERRKHLKLYPGVQEGLATIEKAGIRIVGHTEAIVQNAYFRVAKLGIADRFGHLYTIQGALPEHPTALQLSPKPGFVSVLPNSERKPNPKLVQDICAREGVALGDTAYVGDSLTRDVAMAIDAGVTAIWARYGRSFNPDDWRLLVRVTHWTSEDVAFEERLKHESTHKAPHFIIDSFAELPDVLGMRKQHAASSSG